MLILLMTYTSAINMGKNCHKPPGSRVSHPDTATFMRVLRVIELCVVSAEKANERQ